MPKRLSNADRERIRLDAEASGRNRLLPEVPECEKVLKRFACGHQILVHPNFYVSAGHLCGDCASKRTSIGSNWWGKLPPR